MRMRETSLLKFNNICMSLHLLKHMTFSQISKQFLQFQLKYTSDQIRSIFSRYTRKKISFEFKSIEIVDEDKKERRLFKISYQSESVLLSSLHVSRAFYIEDR